MNKIKFKFCLSSKQQHIEKHRLSSIIVRNITAFFLHGISPTFRTKTQQFHEILRNITTFCTLFYSHFFYCTFKTESHQLEEQNLKPRSAQEGVRLATKSVKAHLAGCCWWVSLLDRWAWKSLWRPDWRTSWALWRRTWRPKHWASPCSTHITFGSVVSIVIVRVGG